MNSFYQHILSSENFHKMGYIPKWFCVQFPISTYIWTCWKYIPFSEHFWSICEHQCFMTILWTFTVYILSHILIDIPKKMGRLKFWEYLPFYELFLTSGNAGKMNLFLTHFWSIFWNHKTLVRLLWAVPVGPAKAWMPKVNDGKEPIYDHTVTNLHRRPDRPKQALLTIPGYFDIGATKARCLCDSGSKAILE